MTYKMLALDMDGTLLKDGKTISEANLSWIRRAVDAGITVCMATGRGQPNIVPFLEQLGLRTPFVAINGSEVWQDARTVRTRHFLELDAVKALHRIALSFDVWHWAYGVTAVYDKANWIDDISSDRWMKFCYYSEQPHVLAAINDRVGALGLGLEVTNSDPRNLEFNPQGISKATGLREICGLVGCRMEEVVAVGDSMNDVAMIQEAGLGVAMGNAQDAVKAVADAITLTNEEDGVAEVIRRYILQERAV